MLSVEGVRTVPVTSRGADPRCLEAQASGSLSGRCNWPRENVRRSQKENHSA